MDKQKLTALVDKYVDGDSKVDFYLTAFNMTGMNFQKFNQHLKEHYPSLYEAVQQRQRADKFIYM